MKDRIIQTGEAAKILGVSTDIIRLWIDNGTLKGFKLLGSGHRRVTLGECIRVRELMKVNNG